MTREDQSLRRIVRAHEAIEAAFYKLAEARGRARVEVRRHAKQFPFPSARKKP
jgi:hypothetical protein